MKILFLNPKINAKHEICRNLQKKGIALLLPSNSAEALELLGFHGYSIDLAVIHRENRDKNDGLVFIEKLKANPSFMDLPVILTTEQWSDEECAAHQNSPLGVNAYLHTPFLESELIDLCEAVLGRPLFPPPSEAPISDSTQGTMGTPSPVLEDVDIVFAQSKSQDTNSGISIELEGFNLGADGQIATREHIQAIEELTSKTRRAKLETQTEQILEISPKEPKASEPESDGLGTLGEGGTSEFSRKTENTDHSGISLVSIVAPGTEISHSREGANESSGSENVQESENREIEASSEAEKAPEIESSEGQEQRSLSGVEIEAYSGDTENAQDESKNAVDENASPLALDNGEVSLGETQENNQEEDHQENIQGNIQGNIQENNRASSSLELPPEEAVDQSASEFLLPEGDQPEVDGQVDQEMPYLKPGYHKEPTRSLGSSSLTGSLDPSFVFAEALGDAVVPGGAAEAPDLATFRKYLMLRERDVAVLSNQLKMAQDQLADSQKLIQEGRTKEAELSYQCSEQKKKIEDFEKVKRIYEEQARSDINEINFQLKAEADKSRGLMRELRESLEEIEQLKARVRTDIRKIRVREKELENQLEMTKKDSEALLIARENKVIELKRKLDILEFNMDLIQDQYSKEKENSLKLRERLMKAAQVLRIAVGLLDSNKETPELNAEKAS